MRSREELLAIIDPVPEASYSINVGLKYIEEMLGHWAGDMESQGATLELTPDFQRGHVWTEAQQVSYVENFFRGAAPSEITFVTGHWLTEHKDCDAYMQGLYCLDGLQRLTALRKFMAGGFPIFGDLTVEEMNSRYLIRAHRGIIFSVIVAPTRAACLKLYHDFNSGGTPHGEAELARVKALLDAEVAGRK